MNGSDECGIISGKNAVLQGYPLSMHLFVIFLEPLITKLEAILGGLKIGESKIVVRAYFDDLTIVITKEVELKQMEECLKDFCSCFSAKMSKEKTAIRGLGEWRGRVDWPLNWITSSTKFKITGMEFSPTLDQTATTNWERVNSHILGILTKNAAWDMTIEKRNIFLKTFCLSRAIYVAKVLECPI